MKYLAKELEAYSKQINFALDNYRSSGIDSNNIQHIIIAGLGGSGIAGRIVKNYFFDRIDLPVEVVSDYALPAYTGAHSLVILCSYSGNTEETISTYKAAKKINAPMLVITTGGELLSMAEKDNVKCYLAEKGYQPRVALGYSLTYLSLIFAELAKIDIKSELRVIANKVEDTNTFKDSAKQLFEKFNQPLNKKVVIIADGFYEGTAIRFCQQVQENAKLEAFCHILPEANHNVIESYYGKLDSIFLLLDSGINSRVTARFEFIENLLTEHGNEVHTINAEGASIINLYKNIFFLDWLSLAIADHVNAISNTVPNIMALKSFLHQKV